MTSKYEDYLLIKKNKTTYPKKNNNEDNLTQKERERGPKLKQKDNITETRLIT